MKAALFVSVLSAWLLISTASVTAQDTPLWRYTTDEDIEFYRVTPLGDLIVGTKDGVVVLDPETGEAKWTRGDILTPPGGFGGTSDFVNDVNFRELYPFPAQQYNPIPLTRYGLARTNDDIVMIDLGTGESMWESPPPLEKVRGHFPVMQHGIVLVYGEAPENKRTFVAVDAVTGEVRWSQGNLLEESPKIPRARSVRSFIGHQPPLVDSDTTFILNVSKDGPMRIDSRTGDLLWRSDLDEDAPHLREGYAPMLYEDGVLFAPYKKKMVALNTSDGSVVWDRRRDFRSRVTQMELTAHGLVVRGRKPDDKDPSKPGGDFFVDLLDPETGISIWEREYRDFKVNLPFIATDEAVVVTNQEELIALDYGDGSATRFAEFEFEGDNDPTRVQISDGNILISANQNFLALTSDGTVKYQVYYEAPGRDWFQNAVMLLASTAMEDGVLDVGTWGGFTPDAPDRFCRYGECGWIDAEAWSRFRNAEVRADYAYVYTKQPDAAGREGFSLLRIDKRDGEEAGRVWIDERRPNYVLDEPSGMVYVKADDKEIVAFAFPAG